MKRFLSITLVLVLFLSFCSCSKNENTAKGINELNNTTEKNKVDESNETAKSTEILEDNIGIELTKDNFNDYFLVTFSVENIHSESDGPGLMTSLCDLKVFIDSKTSKHPENATLTISIEEIEYDGWSFPGMPIETKTLTIPYNGSIQFSVPLQKNVVGGDLETPDANDFKYVINEISGTIK